VTVVIDGESLSLEQVVRVARSTEPVSISEPALERMRQSRLKVERVLARGAAVYGMTTGLGQLKRHRVAAAGVPEFNRRLLDDHLIGHGARAPDEVVRGTMLRLANGFAKGTVGVRPMLAQRLVDALNAGEHPPVRLLGSAGEADLAPLADLARGLFADVELGAKEGLALVNNNSFSTALAALAVVDAGTLIDSITVAGALDLEAFGANLTILDPVVGESRPYPGLHAELAGLRRALEGSSLWERGAARNLQDPLSYRSIVQVGGAARDVLAFVRGQLGIELNAHHDNPIVTPGEDRIISAGITRPCRLAAAGPAGVV
jgi:histidine ammonia-lyase